jgi:hypothetical protein
MACQLATRGARKLSTDKQENDCQILQQHLLLISQSWRRTARAPLFSHNSIIIISSIL